MLADLIEAEERLELDSDEEEEVGQEEEQDEEEENEELLEQEKGLKQNWMVDWEEEQFGRVVWDSAILKDELD